MCYRTAFHEKRRSHRCGPRGKKYRNWAKKFERRMQGFSIPVNVVEFDDRYELSLYAPGLEKSDFNISVTDRILTISTDRKEQTLAENARWKTREYRPGGFTRQFDLNEKVDLDAIDAKYKDGILLLTLTKREGHETSRHDITIA